MKVNKHTAICVLLWAGITEILGCVTVFGVIFLRQWQVDWITENPISPYQSLPHIFLDADGLFLVGCIFTWMIISWFMWKWWRKENESPIDKSK